MSPIKSEQFSLESTGLEPSSPLLQNIGKLALLSEEREVATKKSETTKKELDSELKAIKEKWADKLIEAEDEELQAANSIEQTKREIKDLVYERYYSGEGNNEEIIYASGLFHGPTRKMYDLNKPDHLFFEEATKEVELFKSIKPGEPLVLYDRDHSEKIEILAGHVSGEPKLEMDDPVDVAYDPLNPKISIELDENSRTASGKWYGLKDKIYVGKQAVDEFLKGWARQNFIPKKGSVRPWQTFDVLHQLAGLEPLGYKNERVEIIKDRALGKVSKEFFIGDNWLLPKVSSRLRDIYIVGGQERFDEVSFILGERFNKQTLTEVFGEMLDPNYENAEPTSKYATLLEASQLAEKYYN